MLLFLLWYFAISLLGVIAFPLAYRLLPALPDRGYALSRTLGLLLWGYIFWLLASLGILRNDAGGLLLSLGIVLAASLWAWRGVSPGEFFDWSRERRRLIIGVELLFLLAFAGWAFVRSANPEIIGTEKPMELAFINAILRSPTFPPHDSWLSGFAISYYYFGYVMVAMLAQLTGTPGSVAFNLGLSLVFALSAVGVYGLVYSLLERQKGGNEVRGGGVVALLGPLFLLIVSNLEGFLHSLHTRGLFWAQSASGALTSSFWKWLDMRELSQPPAQPFSWVPTNFWWWWRASRVLQDYDLAGSWKEIIDEFPFFSYLLGDLHPHVLAMPFALLAIGLTLNLLLSGGKGQLNVWRWRLSLSRRDFFFAALILGGMAFLNTWDFPIYVALFCGAYLLRRLSDPSDSPAASAATLAGEFLLLGLAIGVCGMLLYLPFYLGFSSQAGGIIPNLINPTRGAHLWVMFAPLLLPIFAWLLYRWRPAGEGRSLKRGFSLTLGVMLTLWTLALLMGWGIVRLPVLGDLYRGVLGAGDQVGALFAAAILRRLHAPGGWLTLLALLSIAFGLLFSAICRQRLMKSAEGESPSSCLSPSPSRLFALLLIVVGALLVLAPEFFYLRDQFGWRMNTIFKFYYQAWILWSVAAAYGSAVLWQEWRGRWGAVFSVGLVLVIGMALFYPVMSVWNKTNGFHPDGGLTLDGTAYFERQSADEMAAIRWLRAAPSGVVLEAVGGSYTGYARISTNSGQPTVLGWPGHESQWRGGARGWESRQSEIEMIYQSNDWLTAQELLRKYNVRYVFIGGLERSTYRVNEMKFQRFLSPVFQQGQATIYEVP